MNRFQCFCGGIIQISVLRAENPAVFQRIAANALIQRPQHRDNLSADPVARIICRRVGRIRDIGGVHQRGNPFGIRAFQRQNRPQNPAVDRWDAAEAACRRAARQIEKHRFQLVVCGMRRRNPIGLKSVCRFLQQLIAQRARRLLHPCMAFAGQLWRISAQQSKRNAPLLAERCAESRVPIGLFAANPMVDVRRAEDKAGPLCQTAQQQR